MIDNAMFCNELGSIVASNFGNTLPTKIPPPIIAQVTTPAPHQNPGALLLNHTVVKSQGHRGNARLNVKLNMRFANML
jgi:hypothetical protein